MEDPSTHSIEEDHRFFDAYEDLQLLDALESEPAPPHSEPSRSLPPSSSDSKLIELTHNAAPPRTPSSSALRRRRSFSRRRPITSSEIDSTGFSSGTLINSEVTGEVDDRRGEVSSRADVREEGSEKLDSDGFGSINHVNEVQREGSTTATSNNTNQEENLEESTITSSNANQEEELEDSDITTSNANQRGMLEESTITSSNIADQDENFGALESSSREIDDQQPGFFIFLANLIIKAIGLQFNLMISCFTFPFWALYSFYMFLLNPFLAVRRGRDYLLEKLERTVALILDIVTLFLSKRFKENEPLLILIMRCGWGLFWSAFIGSLLVSLLVCAFLAGGLLTMYMLEEPFWLKQTLNFDFTRNSPTAAVPISTACPEGHFVRTVERNDLLNSWTGRVIPRNHKLQATVGLIVPESYYNRNLGMFQVRIEFLSADGKTLGSFSHSCVLHFKSEPVRLLLTFFKIVPLISGYLSESQTLRLKIKGYTEGDVPTACLKVIIEQRAEFRPGGGIPEVYDAFLVLESQLPFFKNFLWGWRRTILVWVSMMVFMIELLFALVCCHSMIIPSFRPWNHARNREYERTD